MFQEVYSDSVVILKHSGIEVEVALSYALEKNQEEQVMIEEFMKYFGRNHLMLDMSAEKLFAAGRTLNESYDMLQDHSITFNKKMCEIRDKTRKETYRINIFRVSHFKV
jgi:hypothetical protein